MPMMFGFGQQRRSLLMAELERIADELPSLGSRGTILLTDLAAAAIAPAAELDLLLIQETDEPFHRRADFWVTHLRPRVGTHFFVYTPTEYEELGDDDPIIREAKHHGTVIDAPA